MTPGSDGGRRPSGLSRRRLLAGIGGVGAVGMASGLGTGAYLADRETFADNVFGAGEVGLTADDELTDGTVTVGPFAVNRTTFDGRPEPEAFEIGASANPVRVWLATRCPDGDRLGNALEVEVVVDGESLTDGYRPLAEVERELATGRRIDAGCLDPDGGPIVVEVAPYLPADSPNVGGEETDLTVRLYAEQCRHVSEEQANAPGANPFAAVVCEETEADCPECIEFGKADFGGSTAPGDVLPLEMLLDGAGPHEIEITEVETKDDGEVVGVVFRLRDADGNPGADMCSVAVKGGPDRAPDAVDIDPASPETGKVVFAPLNPNNGKRYGVSNVTVSVCAGDDDSEGEEEHGDDRTGDGDSSGNGNGGGNSGKEHGTPGKSGGKSGKAGGDGRSDGGGNDDTEEN